MKKVLAACLIAAFLGVWGLASFNTHTVTITVSGTDRAWYGKGSKWLVLGTDANSNPLVLENTDNLLRLKFNSSDIQAVIEEDKTYEAEVIGFRIPFLSWYENIISIEEVKK